MVVDDVWLLSILKSLCYAGCLVGCPKACQSSQVISLNMASIIQLIINFEFYYQSPAGADLYAQSGKNAEVNSVERKEIIIFNQLALVNYFVL